jgi:geranylgeranyl diphosphate synthase, type I
VLPKSTNSQTSQNESIAMSSEEQQIEEVKKLLEERSKRAINNAKSAVIEEEIKYPPLKEALTYFMTELWFHSTHPALSSLTCEAVGGDKDAPTDISTAIVVLAGAADIHDDLIDKSKKKYTKLTIFGKYGKDIAIIAGDIMWLKGMSLLNDACDQLSKQKKKNILELVKKAFFDIGSFEAKEAALRANLEINPEEFLEILNVKVSVAEASAKIGAIIGNGTKDQIKTMGEVGKNVALLMTIRNEYIDMFERDELKNRYKNECLPLPIIYALQNSSLKKQIIQLLENKITEKTIEELIEIVTSSEEVHKLGRRLQECSEETKRKLVDTNNKELFLQILAITTLGLPC